MIPILTFDMMGAATSSGLFERVVPRVALKLRPTRGPAQGVWSHAPARHYLWVRPDLFFSGEAHTMSGEVTSPVPARTLVVAVVVAGWIAGSVLLVGCAREKTRAPGGGSDFQERARDVGIAFRMHDLPKEQGERFRINLYDHGSGLAVGDYDNDGHEDIYFLDQQDRKSVV